jgi:hypothetical protein
VRKKQEKERKRSTEEEKEKHTENKKHRNRQGERNNGRWSERKIGYRGTVIEIIQSSVYLALSVSLALEGRPGTHSVYKSDHWEPEPLSHLCGVSVCGGWGVAVRHLVKVERRCENV